MEPWAMVNAVPFFINDGLEPKAAQAPWPALLPETMIHRLLD
jgi:hypothetical protein